VIHLHVSHASCLSVKNVHVDQALRRLPLCDWSGLAHRDKLQEVSGRTLFTVATSASKNFRFHEILEILIASSELKLEAAFLAAAQEDAI